MFGVFGKIARPQLVTISSFSLLNICIVRNESLTEILFELPITNRNRMETGEVTFIVLRMGSFCHTDNISKNIF